MKQAIHNVARNLFRTPSVTLAVLVTLAIGTGASTCVFGLVNAVMLRPLPFRAPERLITIDHFYPTLNNLEAGASAPGYRDLRENARIFEALFVETGWRPALTGRGDARRLTGARVSGQFFATLGVLPEVGRALREDEDAPGTNRVVVVSHAFWQREFGGEHAVVGQKVDLDGEPYEIVGVMPRHFEDVFNRRVELWTPIALSPGDFAETNRTNEYLFLIARLKPGVSFDQAQREMSEFATDLKQRYLANYGEAWTLKTSSLIEKKTKSIRGALLVLLGAVGFLHVTACANVVNLMLMRGAERVKEFGIRSALGAPRELLIRDQLIEGLMLSVTAGALGVGLAFLGMKVVVAIDPANVPRVNLLEIDRWVVVFAFLVSVFTGVLCGLVPALSSLRMNPQDALKQGGRTGFPDGSGRSLRNAIVVVEMALSLMLLTGAGLLLTSFLGLAKVDPGFAPHRLLTFNLSLPTAKYSNDTLRLAYWQQILPTLRSIPGVQAVAATSTMPFGGFWLTSGFWVEGYEPVTEELEPWGDLRLVSSSFHTAMQVGLQRGRLFDDRDNGTSPLVVIVDDEAVKRFWPDDEPIGKRITLGNPRGAAPVTWITVVGVVNHTKHEGLDAANRLQIYFPLGQMIPVGFGVSDMAFAVRTAGDPRTSLGAIRSGIQRLDPNVPIAGIATMEENIAASMGHRRLLMLLLVVFATLALGLSSVGVYGVISFAVTQRSHEMGVRMSLGATRRDVIGLVMRNGMLLALIGTAIGGVASVAFQHVIKGQLFGVSVADPATWVVAILTLFGIAALATLTPALRATRVDPVVVLREK